MGLRAVEDLRHRVVVRSVHTVLENHLASEKVRTCIGNRHRGITDKSIRSKSKSEKKRMDTATTSTKDLVFFSRENVAEH